MWCPTHVQVTVQKARGLITKGKHGTNDAFVTIGLGKEKYQTSIKEKAPESLEWHEKCELQIPKQGNTAEITLTALHHNFLGVDEFLGYVNIPLADLDVYERPKNRWYKLKDKPGKEKNKDRGELEVKIAFIVKAGSLADLSKKEKHKSSLGQLSQALGGSLISISSLDKRKGLKKLASKIGTKMGHKSKKDKDKDHGSTGGLNDRQNFDTGHRPSQQVAGDADPGVISEGESEDDFMLDDLSHKGSGYSLEIGANSTPRSGSLENLAGGEFLRRSDSTPPVKPPRTIVSPPASEPKLDEWEQKLYGKYGKDGITIEPANTLKRRLNTLGGPLSPSVSEEKVTPSTSPTPPPIASTQEDEYIPTPIPRSQPSPVLKSQPSPVPRSQPSPVPLSHSPTLDVSAKEELQKQDIRSSPTLSTSSSKSPMERIIIGGETEKILPQSHTTSRLSPEVLKKFEGKSREDLVEMVVELQAHLSAQNQQQKDLEEYLDNLLVRVMETSPRILQNPYSDCKTQANSMIF